MAELKHPIPLPLEPVYAFVNSLDEELHTDDWADGPAALGAWLLDKGLLVKAARVSQVEYQLALELRAGLRELALANNDCEPDEGIITELRWALRQFPLTVHPVGEAGSLLTAPEVRPVMAAFGRVVTGYALAVATGDWLRLRRCPADDCAWVFWDSSAKGARRWCTMRVCGNRAKARAFAERRRSDPPRR